MICHHYRCIFIHIPKNAGQSIEHVFLNLLGLNWKTRAPLLLRPNDRAELGPPRLAHLKANEYVSCKYLTQAMFEDYFKFAIVRNPWSRMVSIYKWFGFDKKCGFKTFLMGEFKNKLLEERSWFVGPQSNFVYNDNGDLLVDYIGYFEDLQTSFNQVCKAIGIPPTHVPHINKSKKQHPVFNLKPRKLARFLLYHIKRIIREKPPVYKTYQEYYDLESKEYVAEVYSRDIDLFNYTFE